MFLIWHGSIVRALNRISSKFPLGFLGKTLAQQLEPFTLGENPWACGLGLLGFPGGSRRLTPGNGLPLLFAMALENVGGRTLIRGGRVLVGRAALSVRHLLIGGYVYLKHHIIEASLRC